MRIWFEEKGGTYKIDVPFHPIEITFEQFCDFKTHEAKYFKANQLTSEEKKPGRRSKSTKAARHFLNTVRQVVGGDIDQIPFNIPGGEDVKALFGSYTVKPGDELSITRLYAHVVNTINHYKPPGIDKHFSTTIDGTEYHLTGNATEIISGTGYTAGEVFETLEYQRRGGMHVQRAPAEIGNIEFNLGLTELAILLRKKGERLPSNETDRRKFIDQRKQVFAKATLDTVLDLRFFFGQYIGKNRSEQINQYFWEGPPRQVTAKKTRSQREKEDLIEEAWQHTGYRIYYGVGMEKRWFEGQEPTPWQSVFYSDFADFTKLYSIDKARL